MKPKRRRHPRSRKNWSASFAILLWVRSCMPSSSRTTSRTRSSMWCGAWMAEVRTKWFWCWYHFISRWTHAVSAPVGSTVSIANQNSTASQWDITAKNYVLFAAVTIGLVSAECVCPTIYERVLVRFRILFNSLSRHHLLKNSTVDVLFRLILKCDESAIFSLLRIYAKRNSS